jgi:membrane fusion protein (multidrug efflux system)
VAEERDSQAVLETEHHGAREPWPEEGEKPSRRARAGSYFRQHPAAKWVLIAGVIIIAALAVLVWRHYSARESTDDAQIDGHIAPISARVSGTVTNVYVNDNQYVKAGTVLVQLDPTDYRVAVERAQAELADAEASARAARTGVPVTSTGTSSQLRTAQADLAAAQDQVNAARARLREAEARHNLTVQDLNRLKQLVARDEISQQRYDTAVTAEQQAAAAVDAARAAVSNAQSQVAQARAKVDSASTGPEQVSITRSRATAAEATVARLRAALEQAQLNLQYTTLRAPINGVVSKKSVEPGQVVQAGQPLLAVVNLDDLWVTANFKENQLKKMHPGQPATISVDAYGRKYKGHVESIGGATGARFSVLPPENATGNYVKVVQRIPVKIVFEKGQDPDHLLRPGMSVVPTVMINK